MSSIRLASKGSSFWFSSGGDQYRYDIWVIVSLVIWSTVRVALILLQCRVVEFIS